MKNYIFGFLKYFFFKKISKLSLITDNSIISSKTKVNRFCKIYSSYISDYTYIGPNSKIINSYIGKYCSIASGCNIGLANHTINNISTSPIFTERTNGTGYSWVKVDYPRTKLPKIEIGNDVWIGERVIIISKNRSLRVGNGAIIGAGSIVTKDVPPYAILAGVPAKIIRFRFNQDIINKLQEIEWWNLSESTLKKKILIFQKDNITMELLKEFN